MDVDFCLKALADALDIDTPDIFNTDQGSQFTSIDFTEILTQLGFPKQKGLHILPDFTF